MTKDVRHDNLRFAAYYAPRGRDRLQWLGESIAQRYLSARDQLIGIMGESGTGKSSIIRGMFPGLELTNDDEGVNVRPLPLIRMHREEHFTAHTLHIDIRFEMAFTQPGEMAEAIRAALKQGKRVVVEHFEEIHPLLKINAQFLMGAGEDILVVRPNLFGPFPEDIGKVINHTAIFRKMAHSAEDIVTMILEKEYGISKPERHGDVPRGFVLQFAKKPSCLDLGRLEERVKAIIQQGVDISYLDEGHIMIGKEAYACTGPRIHVRNSSEIRNFRLMKELAYDEMTDSHCLVGLVAEPRALHFIDRHPDIVPASVKDLVANSTY
ncbi:MAG: alanine-tRNA synthetase second additional domain-containing protein [Verrucomicrobiae bacterium]|nr:alanine-tRNA synthetase second additional domain-containing protein [Verrucomicrobiae bacterium]